MSTTKRKLSLKKSGNPAKHAAPTGNTIISMFKKQEKIQNESIIIDNNNSGSDGDQDVLITKVSGLEKTSLSRDQHKQQLHKASTTLQSKLSLSGKKKSKQADSVIRADRNLDEPTIIQSSRKPKRNLSKSKSLANGNEIDKEKCYKLRKRHTVPIVEISESDDEFEGDGKASEKDMSEQGTSRLKLRGKYKRGKDINTSSVKTYTVNVKDECSESSCESDSVVDKGTDIERSKYFNSGGKRKLSSQRQSGKLSLKKMKTSERDSDVSKQNKSLGVNNDSCKNDRVETKSDEIISYDLPFKKSRHSKELNEQSHDQDLHKDTTMKSKKALILENTKDGKRKIQGDETVAVNSKNNVEGDVGDIQGNSKDKDSDTELPSSTDSVEFKVPYYLENFKMIMKTMLDDMENARLFDDCDMMYVNNFNSLEEPSQKLYVRLFSRKWKWLSVSKVTYPEISDDIPSLVDELTVAELLHSGDDLHDLPTVLKILSAPDLKLLAKSFHINCASLTKDKIIDQLLKKSQQNSISALFKGGNKGTMERTILTRAKSYLGKACRLRGEPRTVYIRLLMLFSLYSTNFDEESGGGGQNQLFQMLMVNIGRVVYPTYVVNRQKSIFQDRSALVRFETSLQFEIDIQSKMEQGKWKDAYEIYKEAKVIGDQVCHNKQYMRWDAKLPQFLRFYTAGSIYVRIDSHGVEILQRLKLYQDAVNLLEKLLKQDLYCEHYRGHWYERLALNLEAHLKSISKSFTVLKRGLSDETVRTGRRLALYERARKICEAPKSKYSDRISEFEHDVVLPTPEVQIKGMVMSDATSMGMKYQFIMQGDSDSVTLCAVEELVLDHYKQNGYPEGLHAEGSIISNLFVLLFWDIMFMEIPDVFHGPFQSCPLDMATRDFYLNRKQLIDDRLKWLRKSSVDELKTEVHRVWEESSSKMCSGINWDKFSSSETHQNLISCMGGGVIAGILERYVKDPRHTRSGFPDLTLWNTETKQFKICEVKGPTDRLSYKQILWIDYLLKLGIDAEVCYVKAVGSKKLKPVENRE